MRTAPLTRRFRVLAIAAIAAVAAVVAAVLVPLAAQAAPISLSGVVDGPTGAPLGGVQVTLIQFNGPVGSVAVGAPVTTASNGTFTFPSAPEADYTLQFGATSTTYQQYFGGTDSLEDVETFQLVSGGGDHSFVTAALLGSGTISGKVSKLPSGALSGYTVRAYGQAVDGSWSIVRTSTTSASGSYSETGLKPGSYRLEAIDTTTPASYAPVYSGGTADFSSATSVEVAAGKSTAFNFALGKSGSVSGTVTGLDGASTIENLAGTRVTVYRLAGTAPNFTSATALESPSALTSATGAYSIKGLAPGNYTLEFKPRTTAPLPASGLAYGSTFLGSHDTAIAADYLQIVNGTSLTGRNIQLVAGAEIDGEIDEAESPSTPIPNLRVSIDYLGQNPDDPSEHAQTTITDPVTGTYSFTGLGPGTYQLYVGSNTDSNPNDGIVEDTTRQREIVVVTGGPLASGEDRPFNFTATQKDPNGLYATTAPHIVVSGTTNVGDSLSVDTGVWSGPVDPLTQITYQWFRGGRRIAGATDQSYVLVPGDLNYDISVVLVATDFEYGSAVGYVNPVGPVGEGLMFSEAPNAAVTGVAQVGQTLSSTPGGWTVSGSVYTYRWQTSTNDSTWVDIPNSSFEPTYTITDTDLAAGPFIRVEITATKQGYTPVTTTAESLSAINPGTISIVTMPKVTKTATQFSVSSGTWSPNLFYNFNEVTWTVDPGDGNAPVTHNTATLPVDGTTAGKYITVKILHQWHGYADLSTPDIVAQIGAAPTVSSGGTTIVGMPQVDVQLSAPNPTWSNPNGSSSYQWQYKSGSSWKNLGGGTSSTYTPLPADIGRTLRVVTSRHTTGYATGTLTSTESTVVDVGVTPSNLPIATILGTVGTNLTVTASPGVWTPTPSKISYQWETSPTGAAPYTKISGATSATYTIPQSLLGKVLLVNITATLSGHGTGTRLVGGGTVMANHLTPVKAPKITHVGTVYTASGATFSPAATGVTYNWYVYDNDDLNPSIFHTGPSWDVSMSALYAHVIVIAQGSKAPYQPTDAAPVLAKKGSVGPPPGAMINIASDAQIGVALTTPTIGWEVNNPTIAYQWQYNSSGSTWKSIAGATSGAFTPTPTYFGKKLRVLVTAGHVDYTSSTVTSSTSTVDELGGAPTPGTAEFAPAINGYDAIGSTLTVVPGTWNVAGLAFTYQWQSSPDKSTWSNINGATAADYVVPDADYNTTYFQVVINATKTDYTPGSTTVQPVPSHLPLVGQMSTVTSPVVTLAGGTYTITSGATKPAATSFQYAWNVYDPATDTATQVSHTNSYTPVLADLGKHIDVTIDAILSHYNGTEVVVNAQTGATITPTTPLTITGTPQSGDDLTVNWTTWSTIGPFTGIRWYRNGVLLPTFINSATYTQSDADLGKTITAKVTVSKDGYQGAVYSVAGVGPTTSSVTPTPSVDPAISGTPNVDYPLTATTGTWNVAGLSYSYRWNRDGLPIPGATSSTYVLAAADDGEEVTVTVTARKAGYATQTATSPADTIQDGDQILNTLAQATVTGTVAGKAQLNTALTGAIGGWTCSTIASFKCAVTVTYEWQQQVGGAGSWNSIAGATALTYTPTAGDGIASGDNIRLLVLADRPGHDSGIILSAPIAVP